MRSPESRLSVAIVSPNLLNGGPNGVADFITGIRPHLESNGVKVRTIAPAGSPQADHSLGRTIAVSHDGTRHRMGVSPNKKRAENILLKITPDLVVVHQPLEGNIPHLLMSAAPKKDGKRIPAFVGHFHANAETLSPLTQVALEIGRRVRRPQFGRFGWPSGLTPGFARTVLGELDGRIAVSNATANFWKEIDEKGHEYEVIYNGIDIEELTPEGPKIEAWDDGKQTILFAGRHDPRKGIDHLLEAYRLLTLGRNDIKLKITGEGQMTASLKKMVQEKGLVGVEFLGNLPREELVKAYRTADVFVSPATGGEGFGRTLAEAMSVGTLTVGSDIEGYREVIGLEATGDRGFASMAKPKNPDDLARKIRDMLDLPAQEKTRLGIEASDYVNARFSWESIAVQTIRYYDQVLTGRGRHSREEWPLRENVKIRRERARERKLELATLGILTTIFEKED